MVEAYQKIQATTKRLAITETLVNLLKETPPRIIDKTVYLTQGKLHPDYEGIELGMAEKLVIRSIAAALMIEPAKIEVGYKKEGDLGTAALQLFQAQKIAKLSSGKLTIERVYDELDRIARVSGKGSVDSKIKGLTEILSQASPEEAMYITRMAMGRLRLGVADMTILDALAIALGGGKNNRPLLERAYNLCSDLGYVARVLAERGLDALKEFRVTVGRPIRPMLAERLNDPQEILEKMGGEAAAEYKYDGLRIQCHSSSRSVKLFSRRLEDITSQFPDIQGLVRDGGRAKEFIVEGEAVPVNLETGELLPFQLISQRRGRKYELDRMIEEIPISFFAFDVLFVDGVDYTQRSYPERREMLEKLIKIQEERLTLAHQVIAKSVEKMEDFMEHAIEDGCEGIVAKSIKPDSMYKAGARGWTWIKYKREYRSEMQDTVDLTVVGAFVGRGRRGGRYGALLMAAYDKKEDVFRTVTKLGSGFTDEDLEKLQKLLEPYKIPHKHARVDSKLVPDVWFVPAVVLEVAGSEITLSPIHTAAWDRVRRDAGLAIRFPRFTGKYRDDKEPEQSTTTEEILEMYHKQLKKVKEQSSTT